MGFANKALEPRAQQIPVCKDDNRCREMFGSGVSCTKAVLTSRRNQDLVQEDYGVKKGFSTEERAAKAGWSVCKCSKNQCAVWSGGKMKCLNYKMATKANKRNE